MCNRNEQSRVGGHTACYSRALQPNIVSRSSKACIDGDIETQCQSESEPLITTMLPLQLDHHPSSRSVIGVALIRRADSMVGVECAAYRRGRTESVHWQRYRGNSSSKLIATSWKLAFRQMARFCRQRSTATHKPLSSLQTNHIHPMLHQWE